jgi:hypothetical protein
VHEEGNKAFLATKLITKFLHNKKRPERRRDRTRMEVIRKGKVL